LFEQIEYPIFKVAFNKYQWDHLQIWNDLPFFLFDSREYLPIHLTYEKNIRSCVVWLDVSIQNVRDYILSNCPLFFSTFNYSSSITFMQILIQP
jgi:hypothetical protein